MVNLTGINSNMLKNAPKFYEVAKRIIEITENSVIVAHNAKFDYRILRTEFKRLGYTFKRKSLCTVELAKTLLPEEESYSLGKLSRSLGIAVSDRHRANGDAIATVKLFKILLSKDIKKFIVKDAIVVDVGEQLIRKHLDMIDSLPSETGVFYIYNKRKELIYIGKSRNIKHRLNQLLSDSSPKARKIQKQIAAVEFELSGTELIAHLKLSEELSKNKPKLNDTYRKPLFSYALYSKLDDEGYIELKVDRYSKKKNPLITFSNLQSARHYLNKVIDKSKLCMAKVGFDNTEKGCFKYKIGECNGACVNEESSSEYNTRVIMLIDPYNYEGKNIAIIDKGRRSGERSIIFIENGTFIGLGYFDLNHQISNKSILSKIITPMKNTKEAHHFIKTQIRKHQYKKIISLNES